MSEPALHANVKCISQDDFDHMKGYYHYASHRLLKIQKYIKGVQQEFDKDGNLRRGKRELEEYIFPKEIVQEMESLINDLEHRLRKMFIVDEGLTEERRERMQKMHKEGRIKRGKLSKGVAKLRKAQ